MSFANFYLTNKGAALLAKTQAGTELHFTKASIGKGDVPSGTNIVTTTALYDKVTDLSLAGVETSGLQATIKVQFTNASISASFLWKEIGVFATDPVEGEILYLYANAGSEADTIPAYSSGLREFVFNIIAQITNTTSITATIIKSLIYVTQDKIGVDVAPLVNGKVPNDNLPVMGGSVYQSTAPDNKSLIWLDSTQGGAAKFYNGTAWVNVPAVWG
jgi:hypothetical protein